MNRNKIDSLYQQILDASRVFAVAEREFITASFSDITNEPDNEVINFHWTDEVGQDFSVIITELGLNHSYIDGNSLCLIDSEGELFEIRLHKLELADVLVQW